MPFMLQPKTLAALDKAFAPGSRVRQNPSRTPKEYAEQVLGPIARWVKKESQFSGGNTKTKKTDISGMMAGSNQKLDKKITGQDWEVEGISLVSAHDLAKLARVDPQAWGLTEEEWRIVDKSNFCPGASEGCMAMCLRNSGQMVMTTATNAQIKRSLAFLFARPSFMAACVVAVANFRRRCKKKGTRCAFRLNITSDIDWENKAIDIPEWMAPWLRDNYGMKVKAGRYANICALFPDVQFYDYTKVKRRIERFGLDKTFPKNYWLTWSLAETDRSRTTAVWVLENQITTVTVPFNRQSARMKSDGSYRTKPEPLPLTLTLKDVTTGREHTYPVLDGDAHDLRFLDQYAMDKLSTGAFVGLHFKEPNSKEMAGRGRQGKASLSRGFIVNAKGDHPVLDYVPDNSPGV